MEQHPGMKSHMTLDDLAHALRGIPRDAVMMIEGPDGTIRPVRMTRGAIGCLTNGGIVSVASGSSIDDGRYLVILSPD